MHILVVDNNEKQRADLMAVLQAWGASVASAVDGLDALRQLSITAADAVIMALRLPEIDGLSAARLIVELTQRTRRPCMIAVAPDAANLRLPEAQGANIFDAVLTGPFSCARILETLETCLAAARAGSGEVPHGAGTQPLEKLGVLQFRPNLPMAHLNASESLRPHLAPPGPMRVLIADDDALVRTALEDTLRAAGYDVDAAVDGLAALRALAAQRYDLVLLDYQMPEIDGLAAGRVIADVVPPELRPHVIALTSTPEQLHVHEYGTWSVFDQVIPKSAGLNSLVVAARQYLNARAAPPPQVRLQPA